MNKRIKILVSAVLATIMLVLCIPFTAAAAADATISFSDKANRTVFNADQQVWVQNGITVTNDKGSSTSNVADYAAPARFYKSSTLTIAYTGMMKIVINANTTAYATSLGKSVSGSIVNGKAVTITFTEAKNTYSFQLTDGQVRVDSIEVYTTAAGGSGSEGGNEGDTFVKPTTDEDIVNALYALESGETLAEGPYTLTGVIKTIKEGYSEQYKNITVEIVVGDMTDKPVVCYRLKGDDAATIGEGDTIKVTGELTNYSGTYEFASGCTFTLVKKAEKPFEKPTTPEAIVDALYALESGETLPGGNYTLTGKITSIDEAYSEQYKNITVTIVVGDMTDKPIICYRLKGDGADALKVGDSITVTGTLVDFSGKKEFNSGCTFVPATAGEGGSGSEGGQGGGTTPAPSPDTNDSVVAYIAVAVVALYGIAYVSKKH